LYTVVGRSYEKEGNFEQAGRYFSDALTLLERLDDPYSLARAQTNLAVALFPLKRYGDAGLLLSRAEKIQSLLRDRVGLNVTRHNRRILGHYIAC
jgi:tetratricopeptide (TPR) repeat protein